jgi:small subunit ribosomal protein S4
VKRQYDMLERDFRRYVMKAGGMPGHAGKTLLLLLEQRLGTVGHRLGSACTRPRARQLVNRGHLLVNHRGVHIPSGGVARGDPILLTEQATNIPVVREELVMSPVRLPFWLTREGNLDRVSGTPQREEIDPGIAEPLIVEVHSRSRRMALRLAAALAPTGHNWLSVSGQLDLPVSALQRKCHGRCVAQRLTLRRVQPPALLHKLIPTASSASWAGFVIITAPERPICTVPVAMPRGPCLRPGRTVAVLGPAREVCVNGVPSSPCRLESIRDADYFVG